MSGSVTAQCTGGSSSSTDGGANNSSGNNGGSSIDPIMLVVIGASVAGLVCLHAFSISIPLFFFLATPCLSFLSGIISKFHIFYSGK